MTIASSMLAAITTASALKGAVWSGMHVDEPFAIEAKVLSALDPTNPDRRAWAVEDASGATYIKAAASVALEPGDRAFFAGRIELDAYNWQHAVAETVRVLEHGAPPAPARAEVSDLDEPDFDSRLVSIRGIVADIVPDDIDPRWTFAMVRGASGPFVAATVAPSAELEKLVGAEAVVSGIANILPYVGKRKFMSPQLIVPSIEGFAVEKPAPLDRFAVPRLADNPEAAENFVHRPPSAIARMGLRRIDGRVAAVMNGGRVFVKTAGGRLAGAVLESGVAPACGAKIALSGFPKTDLFSINLARAVWRELSPEEAAALGPDAPEGGATPIGEDFDMDAVLRDLSGTLVSIRGKVDSPPAPGAGALLLRCGGRLVAVDTANCRDAAPEIEPGSTVEASGMCILDTDGWNMHDPFPRVRGFTVAPRSPGDLRIVERPSWWTPGRLASVLAALALVLAATFVWNRMLRLMVERRSRQLLKAQIAKAESDLRVEERTRLAADIHDSVSQTLAGTGFQIDAAAKTLDSDAAAAAGFLSVARKSLFSCREELRRCIWDLRNDALEEPDFAEAVRRTVRVCAGRASVAVRFAVRRSQLSDTVAHAILSIARELVANAVRHGRAGRVWIAGEHKGASIRFSVRDDGCGFDPASRPGAEQGHFGLQGIVERVASLGGEVKIESAPGRGAKATVEIGR